MAITLNGTTGITTPSTTSSGDVIIADKIVHSGDTDTTIRFPAADTVTVETSGTERLRIDSAGNVGIGLTPSTSAPLTGVAAGALQVNGNIELRYAGVNTDPDGARYFNIVNTDTTLVADQPLGGIQWIGLDTDNPNSNMASITSYCASNAGTTGDLRFKIAGTEKLRLYADGTLGVFSLAGSGSRTVTAGSGGVLAAASDSRLKQEVPTAPIPGLAEIMQLEPKAYKWLDDIEKRGEEAAVEIGFFANDVKHIIPSAAPMGNDGYYGFYDRAVIAALTKAVQEQQTIIQELAARIEALETIQ